MKNVVAALVELSAELGLPLNLGGGITRGDRLEEFKRGFANREQPWHTSEIVCDPERLRRLVGRPRAAGGFFPAYRSLAATRRFYRGRAREGEGGRGLAAVAAPGRLAEVADRVERDRALVLGAAEQVGPGRRGDLRRACCRWGRTASPPYIVS